MKKKSDGAFEISSWVNKSRRLEERKNAEKEALRLSKAFEEQVKIYILEYSHNAPFGNL